MCDTGLQLQHMQLFRCTVAVTNVEISRLVNSIPALVVSIRSIEVLSLHVSEIEK